VTVAKTVRIIRLQEWAKQIEDCRSSGMSVRSWCNENGIGIKNYYYRMRRVREELLDAIEGQSALTLQSNSLISSETPVFAPIPQTKLSTYSTVAATIQIGTYIAEINNGADLETVDGVLRTLSRL